MAALLLSAGLALTAYTLASAGAVAAGVLHFSLLVAFILEVLFRHAVLDWSIALSVIGLEVTTYLTAYFFGQANP